jgi:hypothetical protein
MSARILILSNTGREVHFPDGNNAVAVCWNTKTVTKSIKGADGLTYKAEVRERTKTEPYIDFVSVREYAKDDFVEDEDSTVAGGISVKYAESLAQELIKAVAYIKKL